MGEYDSSIALAKRLITKKGQAVTLRSLTTAAPVDEDKPWNPGANVPSDQTVMGVFLDYEQRYIDGALIKAGDQRVLMPATDTAGTAIAPAAGRIVLRGQEKWEVITVKPLAPAGDPVMFELQVRQ